VQSKDNSSLAGPAGRRALILTFLIVAVTFFWVLILFYTNLPTAALAAVAVLSVLVLSVATAWTAMAFPSRNGRATR